MNAEQIQNLAEVYKEFFAEVKNKPSLFDFINANVDLLTTEIQELEFARADEIFKYADDIIKMLKEFDIIACGFVSNPDGRIDLKIIDSVIEWLEKNDFNPETQDKTFRNFIPKLVYVNKKSHKVIKVSPKISGNYCVIYQLHTH